MKATAQGTSEKLNIEIEYKVQGCKGKTLPLIIAKKASSVKPYFCQPWKYSMIKSKRLKLLDQKFVQSQSLFSNLWAKSIVTIDLFIGYLADMHRPKKRLKRTNLSRKLW